MGRRNVDRSKEAARERVLKRVGIGGLARVYEAVAASDPDTFERVLVRLATEIKGLSEALRLAQALDTHLSGAEDNGDHRMELAAFNHVVVGYDSPDRGAQLLGVLREWVSTTDRLRSILEDSEAALGPLGALAPLRATKGLLYDAVAQVLQRAGGKRSAALAVDLLCAVGEQDETEERSEATKRVAAALRRLRDPEPILNRLVKGRPEAEAALQQNLRKWLEVQLERDPEAALKLLSPELRDAILAADFDSPHAKVRNRVRRRAK